MTVLATPLSINVLKEKYKALHLTKKYLQKRFSELMTDGCPQSTSGEYFVYKYLNSFGENEACLSFLSILDCVTN